MDNNIKRKHSLLITKFFICLDLPKRLYAVAFGFTNEQRIVFKPKRSFDRHQRNNTEQEADKQSI